MELSPAIRRRRREHWFYMAITVAFVITVFSGFAPTYYLRPVFTAAPLMPLLHLHGLVFSSWLVLFLVQTTLVAANRTDIHRRLGMLGGVIAGLMVIIGFLTAVIRASQGATPPGGPPALVFLVVPIGDMLVFAILVSAGFYFRRRADVHKRLMLLATISILTAAIARLPFSFIAIGGPPVFFALTDIFILFVLLYDLITLRRIHRTTALAGLLIIALQPLRLVIGGTHAWLSFATWLTHWVR
jgi:hypothetical protein